MHNELQNKPNKCAPCANHFEVLGLSVGGSRRESVIYTREQEFKCNAGYKQTDKGQAASHLQTLG